jgi:muramidase (phage lysozyme)
MDASIPNGAVLLLNLIGNTEAPKGYDTLYNNKQVDWPKRLTSMTVTEVITAGPLWAKKFGSSAAGRYQFLTATLKSLRISEALSGDEKFKADLQDRLGYALLDGRGYERFVAGKLSVVAFGLGLAKEWASFPVLEDTQGAHRMVKRGETYYAGDLLNKALVSPEKVEAVLEQHQTAVEIAIFAQYKSLQTELGEDYMNVKSPETVLARLETNNARAPIQFIAETVTINKPILTQGADVFISCSSLNFVDTGLINTGYSQPAADGVDGLSAGNITIIARSVEALRLITHGQAGGKGSKGSKGRPGTTGDPGTPSHDGACLGKSARPPSRGGDGAKGGPGGSGGTGNVGRIGGASGDIHIRYVKSSVELSVIPPGVQLSGGPAGLGGDGGEPGPGGAGGNGMPGGKGVSCIISGKGKYAEDTYITYPDAAGGTNGLSGDPGQKGAPGVSGTPGKPGRWLAERFASDDAFSCGKPNC